MQGCIDDDGPKWKIQAAGISRVAREVDTARFVIEMSNPQVLARRIFREAAGEEGTRGLDSVELQRRFGTLISHAAALAEPVGDHDANRIGFGAKMPPL